MPKKSEARLIAEKHQETMVQCTNFNIWARRFLRNKDRVDKYEEAFNLVNKSKDSQTQEDGGDEETD